MFNFVKTQAESIFHKVKDSIKDCPDGAYLAAGVAVGSVGALVLAPVALGVVGFGAAGPIAGSIAAGVQAGIGNVAAGSAFAGAQSLAMAGVGVGTAAAGGAAGGSVVAGVNHLRCTKKKGQNQDCKP